MTNGRLSLETLPSLGIALSNAFGLLCVLTLLGYGLVAIPKRLWRFSDPEAELRLTLFRCADSNSNKHASPWPRAIAVCFTRWWRVGGPQRAGFGAMPVQRLKPGAGHDSMLHRRL